MRKTYIAAGVIALLTLLWFATGFFADGDGRREAPSLATLNAQADAAGADLAPTPVRARTIHAARLPERVAVSGKTENKRTVAVAAETRGRVVERPVERGDQVATGDLLCRLAIEDREARMREAKEATNQARIEYEGSLRLKLTGHQSEAAIAQARARLASAQAQLEAALLDIDRTAVRAPFAGVLEETPLEVGDYVQPGGICAVIVDLHPMLLVGGVSERDVPRFNVGSAASGRLATGETVAGVVSFVGHQADVGTRTYRVEITVPNKDYALRSGVTTAIGIDVGEMTAHKVSPALLALDDDGAVGVRIVDDEDRVRFVGVDVVADDEDGVWVRGLPPVATLITVGHQFVVDGQLVVVQLEGVREPSAGKPDADAPGNNQPRAGQQVAARGNAGASVDAVQATPTADQRAEANQAEGETDGSPADVAAHSPVAAS